MTLTHQQLSARRELLHGETQKVAAQNRARLKKTVKERAKTTSLLARLRRYNSKSVRGINFCVVQTHKNEQTGNIDQVIIAKKTCKNIADALKYFSRKLNIPSKDLKHVRETNDQIGTFLCTYKVNGNG